MICFLVKPAVVKIFLSEDQIFAGRELTARCETWGSSPAARIVWRLGGDEIGGSNPLTTQRSNSTVSKISLVLGKNHDGRELTCRAENPRFPGGVLEETRTVRVLCKYFTSFFIFWNITSKLLFLVGYLKGSECLAKLGT